MGRGGSSLPIREGWGGVSQPKTYGGQPYFHTSPEKWAVLKEFARNNRKNPTEAEDRLWQELRKEQLGVKFRRQHAIEDFIVDFVCLEKRLVVEVNGEIHEQQKEYDEMRTAFLEIGRAHV